MSLVGNFFQLLSPPSNSIMDTAGVYGNQIIYALDSRSVGGEFPDPWVPASSYNTHYWLGQAPHGWALNAVGHLGIMKNAAASFATAGVDIIEFRDGTVNANYTNSIASSAKNVICYGEANGINAGYTFAQNRDAFITVLDGWVAAGKRVYLLNGTPYEALDAGKTAILLQLRDWLEFTAPTLYPYGQVISVNSWDATATGRSTNVWKAGYSTDGLHPVVKGAQAIGVEAIAPKLVASIMPNSLTQTWRDNATGVINTNSAMTGTTGTIGTRWVNGGNGCPTGWATGNNGSATTGLTATLTKETRSDGYDWWKVVVTGTPTATGGELTLQSPIDYTQVTVDQWAMVIGELEWENATNIHTICLQGQTGGGTAKRGRSMFGFSDTDGMPVSSAAGRHRSPSIQRIAGTTSMNGGLFIRTAAAATTTTATIWFRDVTARIYADAPA